MKYIIYFGSTTDGKEHWAEFDSKAGTGIGRDGRSFTMPIDFREEARREYYPFLEPI